MITSIRIDDNKKTPFKYIQKIKAFKNGSEFIFKPGVNVIVGKNGSGKSMSDLIENASEKKYRFRLDYMDEELTVDEFIRGRIKKVVDSNIETMVESKAKSFVNELRRRYDMAFAAFVVDNMRKQNMLKEDKIAELLKDNPNEK